MSFSLKLGLNLNADAKSFVHGWRRRKSAAFELGVSTGGGVCQIDFWGKAYSVYANANLSIYSGQACNARCPFCVEELRPASRGRELDAQRTVEVDDEAYFASLADVIDQVRPLNPSVSITGGEASKDPRLPRILRLVSARAARRRTITTNGSGLLDLREGQTVLEWIVSTGVRHLNISIAHPDPFTNARLMRFREGLPLNDLRDVVRCAKAAGTRVRLSCVLIEEGVSSVAGILEYLAFARSIGVDNVIFRQLMKTDPQSHARNFVVLYSDRNRTPLEPILDELSADARFGFQKQIVGYYYYVEVWRAGDVDVVFEEADLSQLERTKRTMPGVVHELVFHPNGTLATTWQPWDGVLGPGSRRA